MLSYIKTHIYHILFHPKLEVCIYTWALVNECSVSGHFHIHQQTISHNGHATKMRHNLFYIIII